MDLSNIQPAPGSVKHNKRIGRGPGSGKGGTSTRGLKGAKSRSGYKHKIGFEGGQMPLQRRLPKRGFKSLAAQTRAEVRLSDLDRLGVDVIDILVLKQAGLVPGLVKTVKVILSGEINRSITLNGLVVTKGAKAAIEEKGGKVA